MLDDIGWLNDSYIPQIMEKLDSMINEEEFPSKGSKMVDILFEGGINPRGTGFNTIPPSGIVGSCQSVLIVFIGKRENLDIPILEAVKHVNVKCKNGKTNRIVFLTVKWDMIKWSNHKNSFLGCEVLLKLIGQKDLIELL